MQLRMTPYQHQRWSLIAKLRGQSMSAYVRSAADEVADRALEVETRLERMIAHLIEEFPEAAESLRELLEEVRP
jgi:hypothetical protein